MLTQASLRIHSVKCVDETNGQYVERFGNDEIWLGGYTIAANGSTQVVAPWPVYPHFDDGEIKVFEPPRVFQSFALGVGGFPKEFGVGLVLVEKDNGGMGDAIAECARIAQAQIQAQLARRPAATPGAAPLLVSALKWAISVVAPVILAEVKRRVLAAYNDDIFPPQHATLFLAKPNFSFSGSSASARSTVRFQAHQGIYELTYDWLLVGDGFGRPPLEPPLVNG
jgi:hypothetical protein